VARGAVSLETVGSSGSGSIEVASINPENPSILMREEGWVPLFILWPRDV
jgi:hypothetical protein